MLKLMDLGCNAHDCRQFTLRGLEAELMENILYNLPREGDFHTFICEHGHTHHVSFHTQAENFCQVATRLQ